jgi:acyl-homoserine-lactone acylase
MPLLRLRSLVLASSILAGFVPLAGPASASTHQPHTVSITLTTHGIPHILASDYRGLGYGEGYAMAENDLCGLAATFITYSGERAQRFGEDKTDLNYLLGRQPINNAASDFATRLMISPEVVERARKDSSPQIRALLEGYAQGFNSYFLTTQTGEAHTERPQACRDADAVRPITADDLLRRAAGGSMFLSSGLLLQQLYDAAPPAPGVKPQALVRQPSSTALFAGLSGQERALAGSNGYAFGKDVTDTGSGLLLGNPHFFWDGPNRFVQVHLTIPGEYDAMGVAIPGLPLVTIGFNRNVAWTHTVSTDLRGTIYRLKLDPTDPTHYLVDGHSTAMSRKHITIQVRTAAGAVETRSHDFWMTTLGPVLTNPAMPWTAEYAYVLSDADQANDRSLQQWLEIGKSQDVAALERSLRHTLGLPWVNTIAADRNGHAFYADISVAPDFDAATLHDCSIEDRSGMSEFLAVMDGSRSACRPATDRSSAQPDLLPARARPTLTRTDFVANSNGSYWLTNAAAPLEGFSPVMGEERTPQSLRTRQGQVQVADRLQGKDGLPGNRMSQTTLEQILFSSRSLQAELVVPAVLEETCKEYALQGGIYAAGTASERISRGCFALTCWNQHYDLGSTGSQVFTELVRQLRQPGGEDLGTTLGVWRVPFDVNDPVHTPRDFNAADPAVSKALSAAVERLDKAGIALDAKLGDIQFATRKGIHIPLHGGATYSAIHATLTPHVGYSDPMAPSNSYIQVVTFDATGPVADAILTSSQTPDPESPFFDDQTWAYSRKQWTRLPFTPEAIKAAAIAPPTVLNVPPP